MTPDDREQLQILRRQQEELRLSLARIGDQLDSLEAGARNGGAPAIEGESPEMEWTSAPPVAFEPPPLGTQDESGAARPLPPLPDLSLPLNLAAQDDATALPPPPADHPMPPLPPDATAPVLPPVPRPSLEFQFGRWLTRIGAVFGVITLVLVLSLTHGYLLALLGRAGIIGLSGAICMGVIVVAQRIERRGLVFFGLSLLALGLAGLYVTLYAAHGFEPVRVISSPLLAGVLLLLWSGYVFFLAERKHSQALALFAITLAYFSTAINPLGHFAMAADLLLAGTAVVFLVRHGWAALSYLSLVGTYVAFLRRLLVDENGEIVLDTSRTLPFAPYAVYLIGTWVIFTTAVMLSARPSFRGGKRVIFLSLNNAAVAALLTLTTYIAGYGYKAMGWTLLWTGVVFLATSISAGGRRPDAGFGEVTSAYFAQGLAAFTLGATGVFSGITRGMILIFETLCLGVASTFSRDRVIRAATAITALLAMIFLAWEISVNARHPWLLGAAGAIIMLLNAWWARGASLLPPRELRPLAIYYCALGLGLLATAMASELSDSSLAPGLAFVAVALTFCIYLFPLYELPILAQALMLAAQVMVLFPRETGEAMSRGSTATVAFLTVILLAWWSRQRAVREGGWLIALNFAYSLALLGLAYQAVRPYENLQSWMVVSGLLAGAFLVFGALIRVWPLAVLSQIFLTIAVYHFFWPYGAFTPFKWSGWASAIPIVLVFATGRALKSWLGEHPEIPSWTRLPLRVIASGYQVAALAMVTRWIFGVVPDAAQISVFLVLGTFVLVWNTARARPFGIRLSFVLSLVGVYLVLHQLQVDPRELVTFRNGFALCLLLSQPTILRHGPRRLVSTFESWALIVISASAGWLYVDAWVKLQVHPHYLTMGWSLYALFLFAFGLLIREQRQRWCGLAILLAAIVRVFAVDFWGFSSGYKVVTFFVLTLIALGLGYIYARFSGRRRSWL